MTLETSLRDMDDAPLVLKAPEIPAVWLAARVKQLNLADARDLARQAGNLADGMEMLQGAAGNDFLPAWWDIFDAEFDPHDRLGCQRDQVAAEADAFAEAADLGDSLRGAKSLAQRVTDLREAAADPFGLLDRARFDERRDEVLELAGDLAIWLRTRNAPEAAPAEIAASVAEAIMEDPAPSARIGIGSIVTLRYRPEGGADHAYPAAEEQTWEIVEGTSDIAEDKLAADSPLGSQIMGFQAGDTLDVSIDGSHGTAEILDVLN